MKNWIKKINENKFQFFFFLGILAFLFISLIVIGTVGNNQTDTPNDDNIQNGDAGDCYRKDGYIYYKKFGDAFRYKERDKRTIKISASSWLF